MNIHPKVATSTLATLAWTAICLALAQYVPGYAPGAPLTAAVATLLGAAGGYYGPQQQADSAPPSKAA